MAARVRCQFPEVTINMPDAPRTYHVVKGEGEAVVKALVIRAKEKGVAIRVASPVKRILKGKKGPSGVIAEIDGEDIEFPCKAVIIASGGYANNKEWIKKYAGFDLDGTVVPIGNMGKMGDGIRMAWEMGAAPEGMGVLHVIRMGPYGPEFPFMNVVEAAAIQPVLWVDPHGERFCDEGIAFYDTSTGNVNARFKKGYTFCVFNDAIKQRFMEVGVFRGMGQILLPGMEAPGPGHPAPAPALPQLERTRGRRLRGGLAARMEVDPATLGPPWSATTSTARKGGTSNSQRTRSTCCP